MKKANKKDLKIFLIIFIISCLTFINYLKMHYATDTYRIMNVGYKAYATNWSLNDGRPFMALISLIAEAINLPIEYYVIITAIGGILISSISVIVLKNMILEIKPEKNKFIQIIVIIIAYVTIFNFMYVENMYFVEATVMSLSILLYILSIKYMNKGKIIISTILAIIATMCYQGTITFYLVLAIIFSIIRRNKIEEIQKDILSIIAICAIAYICNIIQIKIVGNILGLEQTRMSGISTYIKNAIYILENSFNMIFYTILFNSCGLYYKGLFLIFIQIIFITVIIHSLKQKDLETLPKMIFILFLIIIATYAMCIISFGSYDTGRIHMIIGATIGILFMIIYTKTNIFENNKFINILLIIYLITYIVNAIYITHLHKMVNEKEKESAEQIQSYIERYERKNNIQVKKIVGFKVNRKDLGFYNDIKNKSVLTYNAIKCSWSYIGAINFYTGRELEKRASITRQEYNNYINKYLEMYTEKEEKDLTCICIGNTLYLNIYI